MDHLGFLKLDGAGLPRASRSWVSSDVLGGGRIVRRPIAPVLNGDSIFHLHTSGFIGAVIGSIVLMAIFGRERH